jgi:hypothetical protein
MPRRSCPQVKTKRGKETAYEAKTVRLAGRRYIVSRTHQDAEMDATNRVAIVAAVTLRPLAPRRGSDARKPIQFRHCRGLADPPNQSAIHDHIESQRGTLNHVTESIGPHGLGSVLKPLVGDETE